MEKPLIANLRLHKSIWLPRAHQMLNFPNPSRLQSLWLGTGAQVLMLPGRLWREFLAIALRGRLLLALLSLAYIAWSSLLWLVWGLCGTAFAVGMRPELMRAVEFLPPRACDFAMRLGMRKPIWYVDGRML